MKVAIVGGHFSPAFATISALKKNNRSVEIVYIGRKIAFEGENKVSFEYDQCVKLGLSFYNLSAGRLQRKLTKYTLASLAKIPVGFFQAAFLLKKLRPDVICCFGGYLSVPTAYAAFLLKIPAVTHEQTPVLGLANKVISPVVQKIAVSWEKTANLLPKNKVVVTGNPLRAEIFKKAARSGQLKEFLSEVAAGHLIYITGGSAGSHEINQLLMPILDQILSKFFVIHQTGDSKLADFERLEQASTQLPENLVKKYFLTKFVDIEDIGAVLSTAALVISRSGANIVWELAALGKVAILIPLAWAGGGEQELNAQILTKVGSVKVLAGNDLTPANLLSTIDNCFTNFSNLKKNAQKTTQMVNLDGAFRLAKVITTIVSKS